MPKNEQKGHSPEFYQDIMTPEMKCYLALVTNQDYR